MATTAVADLFAAEAEWHRAEAEFHDAQRERHRQLAVRYAALAVGAPATRESLHSTFWGLPSETRLSVQQVAEACGKSPAWVYKHIDARRSETPLPYRKESSGSRHRLVFLAGEVRAWLQQREVVVRRGIIGIEWSRKRRPACG